jgi:uncharacterized protein YdhG (YjbR/CyaY superfamily)
MFAWFSFKTPYVRLHVRPPVLADNIKHLGDYATTKAIISFPANKAIPKALVQKLVKASIEAMKQKQKPVWSTKPTPPSRHSPCEWPDRA